MENNVITFRPEIVGENYVVKPVDVLEGAKSEDFKCLLIIGEVAMGRVLRGW